MSTLLRHILSWLGKKLVTLLGIIGILLVALWFRREWKEISKLLSLVGTIEQSIAHKESAISKLRREMEQLGSETSKALKGLESLDNTAYLARKEADEAKATSDYWNSQVGLWQYIFEKWKVEKKAAAWVDYEAKEGVAKIAEEAAKVARLSHQNSPWMKKQSEIDAEQRELVALQKEMHDFNQVVATTPFQRFILAVREVLPTALWILTGLVVTQIGIKAVLFHFIAPLTDRVPPIKITPQSNALMALPTQRSSVSLDVTIRDGEELLVHPDYLQSASRSAAKKTKWFLNHRLPLSSLASGMCLLTKIRSLGGSVETVKISPTKDPLGEVQMIELPAGAAMVLFPRALAAVLKPQDHEIVISRCWRLKSLHSWVTLQFRYLVFQGPCTFVVKGCRGVCIEKPESDKPRLISQAATIGFSADLHYSNTRSENFWSYLRGKDDLFNDLFTGAHGVFVYEEMPDLRRKPGLTGRGWEGITDALLKAFGV